MFPALPAPIRGVLERIATAGGQGFVVGGAVRDLLLGASPTDWDIAATLPGGQLLAVFPEAKPRGGRFGTLWLPCPGGSCDITPCRSEWSYRDRRHPDGLCFHGNILEDLRRRDFTVNAMAYTGQILVDPFGGQQDIQRRILRCVGDPASRFEEDALRVLRLFRFSACLGFQAELATLNAALARADEVGSLSASRVREEVERILLSPGPQALGPLISAGALAAFGLRYAPALARLAGVPCQPLCRWWALLALCGAVPQEVARGFGLSARFMKTLAECERLYRQGPAPNRRMLRRKIRNSKLDYAPVARAFAAVSPEYGAEAELLRQVRAEGEAYRVQDLAIGGEALARAGFSGPAVGRMLEELLDRVIDDPALNRPDALLALAEGKKTE